MKFSNACQLLCSRRISLETARTAHKLLKEFCQEFTKVFGFNASAMKPNFHLCMHILSCIEDYGPLYNHWYSSFRSGYKAQNAFQPIYDVSCIRCFAFERENGCMKSCNTNHRDVHLTYARNYSANFPLARLQRNHDFARIPSPFHRIFEATALSRSSKVNRKNAGAFQYWTTVFLRDGYQATPDLFADAGLDVFTGERSAGAYNFNRTITVNPSFAPIRLCGRQIELKDESVDLPGPPRYTVNLGHLRQSILLHVQSRIREALVDDSGLIYSLPSKKPTLFLKAVIGGVVFGSECSGKRKNSYIFVDNPATFARLKYAENRLMKKDPNRSTLFDLYPHRLMPAKIFAFVNFPIASTADGGAGCIRFALVRYLRPVNDVLSIPDFTIPCYDEFQKRMGGYTNERSLDAYALIPLTSIFCRCVGFPTYDMRTGEKRIHLTPLMFGC